MASQAQAEAVTLSFVVPVCNEESGLPELYRRLAAVADGLKTSWELILIDDGSIDSSREIALSLHARDPRVKLVGLSRNFGHQRAISAGLDFASGEAVVMMDADLQDPPELIPRLVERWREGDEVVHAVRSSRSGDPRLKRAAAHLFYRLLNRASEVKLTADSGDFRLVDRRVVDIVRSIPEQNRYLRGLFAWAGYRQSSVGYERDSRASGKTKYSWGRLFNLAMDGLAGFSTRPLMIALGLGMAISAFSFAFGITAIVLKLTDAFNVPGWASLTVLIAFLSGMQMVMLGAIGLYVGRTYEQVKGRPLYLVEAVHGFGEDRPGSAPGGSGTVETVGGRGEAAT